MRRALSVLALLGLLLPSLPFAYAQSSPATATITAIDPNNFPDIHAYVDVARAGASGQRISGLPPSAFALTENGQSISNVSVAEQDIGVQVVFALDTNSAFKTRDAAGVNRLNYITQALTTFAQTQMKAEADDLTLLTPEVDLITHLDAPSAVMDAVNRYTTEFGGAAESVQLVSRALDFASDATPRPGMRRVLVYLANGLGRTGADVPVNDLLTRAQAAGVQIHTVFVGPEGAEEIPGAVTQRKLSEGTGGLFISLRGPESLAPVFESITNQRRQYHLSYRSMLKSTGEHTLGVRVQLPDGSVLTTPEGMFPLRVEPPIVTLPNLPAALQASEANYAVPIVINFPDGHPRALTHTQLRVNEQIVDTQQTARVETLNWPLLDITESATHTLQVQVTDELGLTSASNAVAVFVESATPNGAQTSSPAREPGAIPPEVILLTVGVALVVIGGVGVYWFLRRRAQPASTPSAAGGETIPGRPLASDDRLAALRQPDTPPAANGAAVGEATISDPASTTPSPALRPKTLLHVGMPALPRVPWPQFHRLTHASKLKVTGVAYLEIVEPGGGGEPIDNIEITGSVLRLGREASLADVIFSDRSVSRLHARIAIAEGVFKIFDEGSTSGTWVNFNQIPAEGGHELKPGDMINLGRVQLRFQLRGEISPQSPNGKSAQASHSTIPDAAPPRPLIKPPAAD